MGQNQPDFQISVANKTIEQLSDRKQKLVCDTLEFFRNLCAEIKKSRCRNIELWRESCELKVVWESLFLISPVWVFEEASLCFRYARLILPIFLKSHPPVEAVDWVLCRRSQQEMLKYFDLECRNMSLLRAVFVVSWYSGIQQNKKVDIFLSLSYTSGILLIASLVDDVKPKDIGEYQFEYWDMWNLKSLFGVFALSGYRRKEHNGFFFYFE